MYNIYAARLPMTIVHRHIFHFYQEQCLGMLVSKDNFAFLAILSLITTKCISKGDCSFILSVVLYISV